MENNDALYVERSGGLARVLNPRRPFGLSWPAFVTKVLRHLFCLVLIIVMIAPFLWMASTSLKELKKVFAFPPDWVPDPVVWGNYVRIWDIVPFARYYLNSLIVVVGSMAGQLIISCLAAYAFARVQFKGRNIFFLAILAMMMVPQQVRTIPLYLIVLNIGMLDTYWAIILPSFFNAFSIFLLRQFFLTIPKDMDEAAIIDGANHAGVLIKIIIPLSKPVLSALTVFIFLASWNSLLWPLIATSSERMRVLTVALSAFTDLYGTDWPMLMTASILVIAPTIVIYLINQQFIARGIVMTGLKG